MIMGSALSALGLLLLVSPAAIGGAVVRIVALILAVAGVVAFIQAFRSDRTAQNIAAMVLGAVVAGLGVAVWLNPHIGTGLLTALLMGFFLVDGVWKLLMAFRFRPLPAWRWMLISGLVSLVFVALLWWQWPVAAAWVIGVLVGLDFLGAGVAMLLLAIAIGKSKRTGDTDISSL
jgi:uncharacterized membrane protein HdeD (DUF308 family)